jgi:hypothetical protein
MSARNLRETDEEPEFPEYTPRWKDVEKTLTSRQKEILASFDQLMDQNVGDENAQTLDDVKDQLNITIKEALNLKEQVKYRFYGQDGDSYRIVYKYLRHANAQRGLWAFVNVARPEEVDRPFDSSLKQGMTYLSKAGTLYKIKKRLKKERRHEESVENETE